MEKYEKKLKESYESQQISNLIPVDRYGIKIKLNSSSGDTKWMNLNDNTMNELVKFYKMYKKGEFRI